MRIYLTGFMGAGKTTVGKRLARALGCPFLDLDAEIQEAEGQSIPELFARHGEQYFREREQEALHRTGDLQEAVVATGGGVPAFADNQSWMNTNGITVYLELSPSALASRLKQATPGGRPLLDGVPLEEREAWITNKLAERTPFYEQATLTVSGLSVQIDELVNQLRALG